MHNISIINLYKTYYNQPILQNINLDIYAGDFLTLLGPSGCGKTTLLNILGGFTDFDAGEIHIDSAPHLQSQTSQVYTHKLPISSQRIKVFQNYVLLPWKTALNQVIFALESKFKKQKNKAEIKDIALHYLELVGLKNHIHKFPHQLSGGQQSRVNIARALSVQPEVLLMDEPFGALDSFTRENLQNELKNLVNTLKTTCVFVTHDVEEALILGNKVIVMNENSKNIILRLEIPNLHEKQDPYFYHLKGEIYESLKYPYDNQKQNYVI